MDTVPYTWRARIGYVPAPSPSPESEPTPLPPPAPATQIMVSHNYYVVVPQPQPLAYAAQIYQAAPVPVAAAAAATAVSKKSSSSAKSTKSSSKKGDAPKVSPSPPPPPAPASEAPAPAPAAPKKDVNEPPAPRPGMNYMFPAEHTKLHIFNKSSKVWEEKHAGKPFNFKIFNVATTFTPAMVIENVLGNGNSNGKSVDAAKWAITEVVEKGDGAWAKGTTIEHAGERAGCSLASMGWTGKRGDVLPPVWVVVHKV